MFFFLIIIILVLGIIVLISLFSPQSLPWYRPHLILSKSENTTMPNKTPIQKPAMMEQYIQPEDEFVVTLQEKVSRLELILNEKNRTIDKLQKELIAQKEHRIEFEKIQGVLEQEIADLKIKNKTLRNQTGESNE